MTVSCKICLKSFTSLLIDNTQAIQEIGKLVGEHVSKEHKQEFKRLGQDHILIFNIAIWYLMMGRYATWLDEPKLQYEFDLWTRRLKQIFSFEEQNATQIS